MSPSDDSSTALPPLQAVAMAYPPTPDDAPYLSMIHQARSAIISAECPRPCRTEYVFPTNGQLSDATRAARTATASDASAAAVHLGRLHRPHRPSASMGCASARDWARSPISRNWTAVSHASIRGLPGSSGREGRAVSRGPGECWPFNLHRLRSTATAARAVLRAVAKRRIISGSFAVQSGRLRSQVKGTPSLTSSDSQLNR
jgi:hypothetical protein